MSNLHSYFCFHRRIKTLQETKSSKAKIETIEILFLAVNKFFQDQENLNLKKFLDEPYQMEQKIYPDKNEKKISDLIVCSMANPEKVQELHFSTEVPVHTHDLLLTAINSKFNPYIKAAFHQEGGTDILVVLGKKVSEISLSNRSN